MRDGRLKARSLVLAPRALAVISCALALLAAQPVGASMTAAGQQTSMVRVTAEGTIQLATAEISEATRESRRAPAAEGRRITETRRVRVLAGVEILRRLLAFELRPIDRQVVPALLLAATWGAEARILAEPPYRVVEAGGAGMSAEQSYVMARCSLAPPLA